MSAQTQKVDVLAVMLRLHNMIATHQHGKPGLEAESYAARAAVADLIEAARLGGDMPKKEGAEHAGMFFTADNAARLRAALNAISGGAA